MKRDLSIKIAILALTLLGIADSVYLFYEHLGHAVVCVGGGCSIVDASIYSEVSRVPTSVIGLVGYAITSPYRLRASG